MAQFFSDSSLKPYSTISKGRPGCPRHKPRWVGLQRTASVSIAASQIFFKHPTAYINRSGERLAVCAYPIRHDWQAECQVRGCICTRLSDSADDDRVGRGRQLVTMLFHMADWDQHNSCLLYTSDAA